MSVSLYTHDDPITFLREWFDARKATNRRYSHRLFARQAGLKNPSALVNVLSGRRRLTAEGVQAFARALRLTEAEAEHFGLLVAYHQEAAGAEKERLREAVQISRKRAVVRELVGHEPEFLGTWYEPAILELTRCTGFRPEPAWIAERLLPPIRPEDVQVALTTLLRVGLLERTDEGSLVTRDASVKTPELVQRLSARMYHEEMLERGQAALLKVWNRDPAMPAEDCWFGGVTMAVPPSQVRRLRQEIVELQHRLMAMADAATDPRERVMQFHFLLFPLSTPTPDVPGAGGPEAPTDR